MLRHALWFVNLGFESHTFTVRFERHFDGLSHGSLLSFALGGFLFGTLSSANGFLF